MSIDPKKQRKIIVFNGMPLGTSKQQNQHQAITELVNSRLGNLPLDFATEMFRCANLGAEAQRIFRDVCSTVMQTPVGTMLPNAITDVLEDLVNSSDSNSTAHIIRQTLKAQIMDLYSSGHPCYLVAHSLGSIYAFDVINEMIRDDQTLFCRHSRKTWPVQGLITLGSPIGLGLFNRGFRSKVASFGEGEKWFRWLNLWDRIDPVVSGNIFGYHLPGYDIAEHYQSGDLHQGWAIRDKIVDSGKSWLQAHVAYWDNPAVGDSLAEMLVS
ncbi:MAG: hypothetical protein ACI9C4_003024 [Paraglaciecola sp.]|jgi:hypothetical protein